MQIHYPFVFVIIQPSPRSFLRVFCLFPFDSDISREHVRCNYTVWLIRKGTCDCQRLRSEIICCRIKYTFISSTAKIKLFDHLVNFYYKNYYYESIKIFKFLIKRSKSRYKTNYVKKKISNNL